MERESATLGTATVTAMQDETGLWFIQNVRSERISKELFISLKVATMAIEGDLFTWDETE